MEGAVGEYQAGFRKNRATIDQIFILKELQAVHYEQEINLYLLFIDFKKGYDTINRKQLLTVMQELEIPNKMIRLTVMTIENTRNRVRSNGVLEVIIRRSGIHRSGTIYDKRHQNLALSDD